MVPKTSLLRLDENMFLSYNEIQKEFKKKELECHKKCIVALTKNSLNLTPYQYNDILKNKHKEKFRSKNNNLFNQPKNEQILKGEEVIINHLNSKII